MRNHDLGWMRIDIVTPGGHCRLAMSSANGGRGGGEGGGGDYSIDP